MSPAQDYNDLVEINCTTGEVIMRPLTNSEVTQRDAGAAAAQAESDAAAAKEAIVQAVRDKLLAAPDNDPVTVADLKLLMGIT